MNFKNTFPAKVINNKDPKKMDRIQIDIPHLFKKVPKDDLPWAYPMLQSTGGEDIAYGKSCIPEKDSMIWVTIENMELFDPIFYFANYSYSDTNSIYNTAFLKVKSLIKSATSYGAAKFTIFKNGITIGVDSSDSNPELFMYHPKGTSLLIDKDGATNLSIDTDKAVLKISKTGKTELTIKDEFILKADKDITIETKKNIKFKSDSASNSVKFNDGTFEVACATDNNVITLLGLQPIMPSTSRASKKPKI